MVPNWFEIVMFIYYQKFKFTIKGVGMTRINRMVMKGFKSFGNRTDLVFGNTFNCVLGPNGSGKSNIMDALCFVLGKGSAKGMRAEKSANLIYNGGKTKDPAKFGEVTIYFDNAEKTFPLDTPEIKVTRIIRDNGQSVYKLNDERKTRQEILDFLALANIDPNGYNIILQGDIVRLVEMTTIERRQIIEEIAGISVYEEKKEKAIKELEKVEQKLSEAEIILTERKTYLKELKKERDQALKYKELDDRLKRHKATLLHMKIDVKNAEKNKLETNIKQYEDDIKKVQEKIAEFKKRVEQSKEEINRINKEIEQKGEKEQVSLMKEIETIKVNVASQKSRISSCEHEIQKIKTRKEQLQASLQELEQKIKELETEKEKTEKSMSQSQKYIQDIDKKIVEFKKKHKMEGAENLEQEVTQLDTFLDQRQNEIQQLREKQQELLRLKDQKEYQVSTMDDKINKVLELNKEHKVEIEKLKQKQKEFKQVTLDLNQLLQEDSSLSVQLVNCRKHLQASQEELARQQAKNAGLRENISAGEAINKILANKNKFGEVFGTVAELGDVETKYSLALEIAAGPRIKSMVVDTDKTAANCINYLKTNKLGTATFLPLNKIKAVAEELAVQGYLKINGVHGQATDLVSFDKKFKNVFSYVFGNTLVVDNLDVARRIGVGNARMVTLDGDLSELSGAMHGGYRQKHQGLGFQQKEVVSAIKKLEGEVADQERLLQLLQKRKEDAEEKITRYRELKATLEGEIIKSEKSLHLDSEDLDATKEAKKILEKELLGLDNEFVKIQTSITQCNKLLAEGKIKKQELRDKIMQLRSPQLLAELTTFEQKKAELKEQMIREEATVKNLMSQLTSIMYPECENMLKIMKQHDKEITDFGQEIKDLTTKIREEEKDLSEKEKQQQQFYTKFKELFTERDEFNQKLQKDEATIITKEEDARSREQRMNLLSIDAARVKAELAGLDEEFVKYQGVEFIENKSEEQIKRVVWECEKMVAEAGNVNMKALEMYDKLEQEYNNLLEKRELLVREKDQVFAMMNEIETRKEELFMKTFNVINDHFKHMFSSLSTKGEAFIEIENPEHPLQEGVAIKVRLTGKKFLDIRSLSGGEKTMTALAFIFAIQEHEPAKFYVFDEVDAALDKKNSEKLSELVKKYSDKAQYIIISHNDGIISQADTLYGVSMDQHNMSKVVSLRV